MMEKSKEVNESDNRAVMVIGVAICLAFCFGARSCNRHNHTTDKPCLIGCHELEPKLQPITAKKSVTSGKTCYSHCH